VCHPNLTISNELRRPVNWTVRRVSERKERAQREAGILRLYAPVFILKEGAEGNRVPALKKVLTADMGLTNALPWKGEMRTLKNRQELGASAEKYVTLSRIVAAAEPISIHESTIAWELTG
jgi:hypothetical protein